MSNSTDGAPFLYARHASAAFNDRMESWLSGMSGAVHQSMGDNLVALVLGGGYGRGEGGVLRVGAEERPYNDLDFVLVVRRKGALPWPELDAIKHKYEKLIGIDVDYSRPLTVDDVRHWPPTLMWSDLLHGHRVLHGPSDILTANAPAMPSERLAPIEATRLLLNRGAGLLWAQRISRGCEPAPDADFIRRNYYKCALALGDALLISHGRFATPYTGRNHRLSQLLGDSPVPFGFDLQPLYDDALQFKFWPGEFSSAPPPARLDELARQWGDVFLFVEGRRAHRAWPGPRDYADSTALREPEQNTLRQWPRNLVKNRRFGRWSLRYPREGLFRELPILLGLCETVPDWPERSARFLAIWKQVN